ESGQPLRQRRQSVVRDVETQDLCELAQRRGQHREAETAQIELGGIRSRGIEYKTLGLKRALGPCRLGGDWFRRVHLLTEWPAWHVRASSLDREVWWIGRSGLRLKI